MPESKVSFQYLSYVLTVYCRKLSSTPPVAADLEATTRFNAMCHGFFVCQPKGTKNAQIKDGFQQKKSWISSDIQMSTGSNKMSSIQKAPNAPNKPKGRLGIFAAKPAGSEFSWLGGRDLCASFGCTWH